MNKRELTIHPSFALVLLGCILASGSAGAVEYNLTAGVTTVTMPGGEEITMWGFGVNGNPVKVPGEALVVPPGEGLRVNLTNNLPAPYAVSLMIPGQALPVSEVGAATQVVRNDDGRIRSFTHEAPNAGSASYLWPAIKAGTYLYQSATHIAVQVQMGLYGALTCDAGNQKAYAGVPYDAQVVLLYSEIDPALHAAVRDGIYGTPDYPSTFNYTPKYFLINGAPFTNVSSDYPTAHWSDRTLLRFLNAGLQTRVPTLNNTYIQLFAEDGNPYPYAKEEYSVLLPAGKTMDAFLFGSSTGRLAIYDRMLGLTNAASSPGGMLTYLDITPKLVITKQPEAQIAAIGSPVSFSVDATDGTENTPTYQWQKDSQDLSDATDSTYNIASISADDLGTYVCVVRNGTETINSSPAALTSPQVVITLQPESQTVLPGRPVSFTVEATSEAKIGLTYQWQKDSQDISDATDATFRIASATKSDAGTYECVVRNGVNEKKSDPATLTIIDLTLSSPDGGESWQPGTTKTITWHGSGIGPSVKLKLWQNGVFTGHFISGIEDNDGNFSWNIPVTLAPGAGYKIQVYTPDYAYSDFSDNAFTLTSKPLELTSPNGGETWAVSTAHTITWNGAGVGPSVKLKLWQNGVFTGVYLTGIEANDGSFTWTIPAVVSPGSGYKIQIYTPDYSYSDFSDNFFTVAPKPLELSSPNGGEQWQAGSAQTITWNGATAGPWVKLRLWRNGVFTGYFLTGIEANDGTYTWNIPNTLAPGDGYKIQVYVPDYSYFDFSDIPFTLVAK